MIAWHDGEVGDVPLVEELIEKGSTDKHPVPEHTTRPVILTSGTTGTPKGAPRGESGLDGAVALLSKMPFHTGGTTYIVAPLFHTWGWAHLNMAMLLGSTIVLRRKFDPADCLETIQEHDVRRADRDPGDDAADHEALRGRALRRLVEAAVVAASGSALPGDLATDWMDAFGDNLYNTYGSTEVAWATIAQPKDMREAPGTAGKAPYNTVVKIYDEDGNPVEAGRVRPHLRRQHDALRRLHRRRGREQGDDRRPDVERRRRQLDEEGRLFVEGRDDEMIVSGGENVFPKEVEDCLSRHENVQDVAAIGVDDDDYGKRLRAFVVKDGDVDEDTLKKHVKDNLARYKVPREIVFLDELPRNATGKVLKKDLKEYDEDGNPASGDDSEGLRERLD